MFYIGSPWLWPSDVFDEFPRLAKGKIDTCDPWAGAAQRVLKFIKAVQFTQVASRKNTVFQNTGQASDRLFRFGELVKSIPRIFMVPTY
jgi:hypothetical protein